MLERIDQRRNSHQSMRLAACSQLQQRFCRFDRKMVRQL